MAIEPNSPFTSDSHFEVEVRRTAKLIWPSGKLSRSPIVEGRERDAIVQTPDVVIVIEATTSRAKRKIEDDGRKTHDLVRKIRSQGFSCRGILVTLHEPTAEQVDAAKQYNKSLELQSFDEFVSRLFDAPQYLQARLNKPFGSIQNPSNSHFDLARNFYIPLPILHEESGTSQTAETIALAMAKDSARFVILADFGSGKSMSVREIFYQLRDRYIRKEHTRFPVYINLRDHSGAKYPDEILERHARDLGLPDYQQIVKAWRAGFVDLILDGFDEFASTGWLSNIYKLRQLRRTILEAVRKLIIESPRQAGIIIVGRQHYFDSEREMLEALALNDNFSVLKIPILSEEDATRIVKRYGGDTVPYWIPGRALLLSYLAARKFLESDAQLLPAINSRGQGWDSLLRMICEREAQQHPALDSAGVLRFLERLATLARRTSDGLGAFTEVDLSRIFQETCGFSPDDAARVLISRLPAIGQTSGESGQRRFVDQDVADAARAADICRFIESPYDTTLKSDLVDAQYSLGENGLDRLSFIAERERIVGTKLEVALEAAAREGLSIAALDLLQLLVLWDLPYQKSHIDIREIQFEGMTFELDLPDISRVSFWDCVFGRLEIAPGSKHTNFPRLHSCLIGSLDGIATVSDLPSDVFYNCEVSELVNSTARNAGILDTDLPMATKVLLTVLNKLFVQSGRGRKENAFTRGLDTRGRALVPQVLQVVQSFGFAMPTRIRNQTIWLPSRDKTRRVHSILSKPTTSNDILLERVRNL